MSRLKVESLGKRYLVAKRKQAQLAGVRRFLADAGLYPGEQRTHRELWALRDVSFDLEPGTILGVIGPNGAGKTTLLKVLARITQPTTGRVTGHGRVVSLLEMGAGFHPDLTCRENIYLNAALYGIPREDVTDKFDAIVDFAGIHDFVDSPIKHYSSGMYLRLAFSVAIHMEPDILLADEVLAVGDLNFQERCLERVREAGKAGSTVLFVSHDMEAITRLCDRVLWLSSGRVVECGTPKEVVSRYQSSAWSQLGGRFAADKTGSHSNDLCRILSVRLLSRDGAELGAVRHSEPCQVELRFETKVPGVGIRCGVDFFAKGAHVFRSFQRQSWTAGEPGVHSARVRVPEALLSETVYSINAGVTVTHQGVEAPLSAFHALSFPVYDTDPALSARGDFKGALAGLITPRLDWSPIEREAALHA